jgi:hypothetical protein
MKTVTLALCLAASVYGLATANESRHAAIVDMPKVITLTHATPDTWHTARLRCFAALSRSCWAAFSVSLVIVA